MASDEQATSDSPSGATPAGREGAERACPACGGRNVHRSRRHGLLERTLLRLLRLRPYRCPDCNYRFYAFGRRRPQRAAPAPRTDN